MLELEKLDRAFNGLKDMRRTPDVIFVVDGSYESQALKEANSLNLPCFAISNTNGTTEKLTDVIPANTNSVKSIDYLAGVLGSACKSPAEKKTGTKVTSDAPKVSGAKKPATKAAAPAKKEAATEEKKPAAKKAPAKK